ncbi:MAG: ABC transporter ATP-binding protein [Anderseniella sp.]
MMAWKNSKLLQIFLQAPGARPWSVLSCVFMAGILDMLSMGAILPAIALIGGAGVSSNSVLNDWLLTAVSSTGIDPTLPNFLILIAVLLVAKAAMSMAAMSYVASSVSIVQSEVRQRLLGSMMDARWSYFVHLKPGQVSNAMAAQTRAASEAYQSSALVIVSMLHALLLTMVATLVSGKLVFVIALAAILISIPLYKFVVFVRESSKDQWEKTSQLGSAVQDAVGNMKAIKSMNKGARFKLTFTDLVEQMRVAYYKVLLGRHVLSYGQDILVAVTITAGIWFGISVVKASLADLLVLGIIYYQILNLLKKVQQNYQQVLVQEQAYFGVQEMIAEAEQARETISGAESAGVTHGIDFADVSFSYEDEVVLKNVNINIPAGKITVLLGPSGAGKTTIIDLLVGLLRPDSGDITIDGKHIGDLDLHSYRNGIGYVPQSLTLLHDTIFANVTLGDESISEEHARVALEKAGAWDFVSKLDDGMMTAVGNMGERLSGGQRQRLSLARALATGSKLLVLDEVTSALDEKSELAICENVKALGSGYTIVVITHRPAWKRIADQVYEVNDGVATQNSQKTQKTSAPLS